MQENREEAEFDDISLFQLANNDETVCIWQPAVFKDFYDPGCMQIKGQDGTVFEAEFFYAFISLEDIGEWQEGEQLDIAHHKEKGFGVVRKANNRFYKLHFTENHPIDLCEKQSMKAATSTLAHESCLEKVVKFWRIEHVFIMAYLESTMSDLLRKAIQKFDESWQSYWRAYMDAYRIHAQENAGSKYKIYMSEINRDMHKAKLNELVRFFD